MQASASAGPALLLACEELHDVVMAELEALHEGLADALEHFLHAGPALTLADLLGAPLDPLGCLVHLGLVGSSGRSAREGHGREERERDPHPARRGYDTA